MQAERDSIIIEEEESLKDYYDLLQQHKSLKNDIRDIVFSPKYCLPFLQPGRLVRIQCGRNDQKPSFSFNDDVTWGILIDFVRIKNPGEGMPKKLILHFGLHRHPYFFVSQQCTEP